MITSYKIQIILACYNEAELIQRCLKSCLKQSGSHKISITIADDGSQDETAYLIKKLKDAHQSIELLRLPHGERGIARNKALEHAIKTDPDYLLIIDADMVLPEDFIVQCIEFAEENKFEALIVPEWAFSAYDNYWTKVKVFERNTIYYSGKKPNLNTSIEGARFWSRKAFIRSGGFHPEQISFEDIQPTLRYAAQGGKIGRITTTHILHDEKKVTLKSLLNKKSYYFETMPVTAQTERHGWRNILQRWYFFRPTLYRMQNLQRYLRQPHLALSMFFIYILLSILAVNAWIFRRYR